MQHHFKQASCINEILSFSLFTRASNKEIYLLGSVIHNNCTRKKDHSFSKQHSQLRQSLLAIKNTIVTVLVHYRYCNTAEDMIRSFPIHCGFLTPHIPQKLQTSVLQDYWDKWPVQKHCPEKAKIKIKWIQHSGLGFLLNWVVESFISTPSY